MNPPRDRPSASVGPAPFLCPHRSDGHEPRCCRSCLPTGRGQPAPPASPAAHRTHPPRPSGDSAGIRCPTCRSRAEDDAIARLSAPSTSCRRRTADCHQPDSSHVPSQPAAAGRSTPTPHPSPQSSRPMPPPNGSVESIPLNPVKLCPRNLEACENLEAFRKNPIARHDRTSRSYRRSGATRPGLDSHNRHRSGRASVGAQKPYR